MIYTKYGTEITIIEVAYYYREFPSILKCKFPDDTIREFPIAYLVADNGLNEIMEEIEKLNSRN